MAGTTSTVMIQLARLVGEFEELVAVARAQHDLIDHMLAELAERRD
jgi:hypothetical protein